MNLKIFFQLYFRSLSRNKFQSITQLVGLSIGISVAVLVFLFLQSELSYDRFHKDHKNIYKYGVQMQIGDSNADSQFSCSPSAGPLLSNYIPEIQLFARTHFAGEVMIKQGNEMFFEPYFRWMDSTGLEIFSFPTVVGDPTTALDDPFSIVLSEELATKYFGDENPVGKTLELEDLGLFTVTAVVEDPPRETDLTFSALLSFHTQYVETPEEISPNRLFGGMNTNLYFLVKDGFEKDDLDAKLKLFYDEYMADKDMINYVSMVEPITQIRLNSIIQPRSSARNQGFFIGFLTIGVIVLILSIINYINICTAGFLSRAKEVAVKKTLGKPGHKITVQFLLLDQPFTDCIGDSPAMQQVFKTVEKVSGTDANVLILGENGTGKELIARAVHRHSLRRDNVFINVDMGAITETLFESQLFGHVKGAFTDAVEDRAGRFETATGGTLFLDEIGNLPLNLQAKLLSTLQTRHVVRVGSTREIAIDIRLVCATNMPLYQMVKEGSFRRDLLYRINTVEIHLPPLRERIGDIPQLVDHFLRQYATRYRKNIRGIQEGAMSRLTAYGWPGNVRELQHTLERAVIMADGTMLRPSDFLLSAEDQPCDELAFDSWDLENVEKTVVRKVLARHGGNVSHAAKELGLTRAALYRRMEKYGL